MTYIWATQIFQKCRNHLKILGARKGTGSELYIDNPYILGAILQNLVTQVTWHLWFVHPWPTCVRERLLFLRKLESLITLLWKPQNMQTYCYTYIHRSVSVCLREYMKFFFNTGTKQDYKLHVFTLQFLHMYSFFIHTVRKFLIWTIMCLPTAYHQKKKHFTFPLCVYSNSKSNNARNTAFVCIMT